MTRRVQLVMHRVQPLKHTQRGRRGRTPQCCPLYSTTAYMHHTHTCRHTYTHIHHHTHQTHIHTYIIHMHTITTHIHMHTPPLQCSIAPHISSCPCDWFPVGWSSSRADLVFSRGLPAASILPCLLCVLHTTTQMCSSLSTVCVTHH